MPKAKPWSRPYHTAIGNAAGLEPAKESGKVVGDPSANPSDALAAR